jgi:ubiquinone/menaquinone biosynthesis C-methylase UbiE
VSKEAGADHFSRVAASYATWRPKYPEELFDYLAGLLHRRKLAWDCGAGTGQATIPLADRFEEVVGTDISNTMLGQAPRHPRVDYRVVPAEASGLRAASVDLISVAQALHWLDQDSFYEEADRVLVPGGILAAWTYGSPRLDSDRLQRELSRFQDDVIGPYWPVDRAHVDAGYRTLQLPFPELDPPAFAMEEQWTLAQLLGYIGTWSATQRCREKTGLDPVPELNRALLQHWGTGSSRRVRWPLTLRVGRKPIEGGKKA